MIGQIIHRFFNIIAKSFTQENLMVETMKVRLWHTRLICGIEKQAEKVKEMDGTKRVESERWPLNEINESLMHACSDFGFEHNLLIKAIWIFPNGSD